MDTITFKRNGVTKNTLTDFRMHMTENLGQSFTFVLRYGDIPINMVFDELVAFIGSGKDLTATVSSDPRHDLKGKWEVVRGESCSTGVKVTLNCIPENDTFSKPSRNSKWHEMNDPDEE